MMWNNCESCKVNKITLVGQPIAALLETAGIG